METTQSILCVTHKKTHRLICGTGSVDGGANWYLVVVGQYSASTSWYLVEQNIVPVSLSIV